MAGKADAGYLIAFLRLARATKGRRLTRWLEAKAGQTELAVWTRMIIRAPAQIREDHPANLNQCGASDFMRCKLSEDGMICETPDDFQPITGDPRPLAR